MSPTAPEQPTTAHTAFVLGGGGILGSTQIGMLQALLHRGITPDLILGTSIGALNGAFLAASPTLDEVERMAATWRTISSGRSGHFIEHPVKHVANLRRSQTLINHWAIASIVEEYLRPRGVRTFADLAVPFQCVAAHIETASSHWFETGLVAPAVAASCAVPGLFPAMKVDGQHFYDGGLVHSIPVGRALDLGATTIYVLQVGRVESGLRAPRWPWEVGMVAFEISRRHRYVEEIATVPEHVELHVLPSGSLNSPAVMSLGLARSDRLNARIEQARVATGAYLDATTAA